MVDFTELRLRVAVHVCYAHVFGEAPTIDRLAERCSPCSHEEVRREVERLERAGTIRVLDGRCVLTGRVPADVAGGAGHEASPLAAAMEEHRAVIGWLRRSELVHLLAVSGSLAWDRPRASNRRPVDLDLFIVCAPDGLHIVRFALRAWGIFERVRRSLGLGYPKVPLCPNYMTDARFLEVTNKSIYTATDALRVKVLKGDAAYQRFLHANRWIERYYPERVGGERHDPEPSAPPIMRSALNLACFSSLGALSWIKCAVRGRPWVYSLHFRFDREISLKRVAGAAGGYQAQVARRFQDIYRTHFGDEPGLDEFLFPGTTRTGMLWRGGDVRAKAGVLGYDG